MLEMKSYLAAREMENMLCWKTLSLHFTIFNETTLHSFEFCPFTLLKLFGWSLGLVRWLRGAFAGDSVEGPDLHISEIARHGSSLRGLEGDQARLVEDIFQLFGTADELALRLEELLVIVPDIVEENDE